MKTPEKSSNNANAATSEETESLIKIDEDENVTKNITDATKIVADTTPIVSEPTKIVGAAESASASVNSVALPETVESRQNLGNNAKNVVSPSRYCAIASLDEAAFDDEERWRERASIITKLDHELYQRYAQEFVRELAEDAVHFASEASPNCNR